MCLIELAASSAAVRLLLQVMLAELADLGCGVVVVMVAVVLVDKRHLHSGARQQYFLRQQHMPTRLKCQAHHRGDKPLGLLALALAC